MANEKDKSSVEFFAYLVSSCPEDEGRLLPETIDFMAIHDCLVEANADSCGSVFCGGVNTAAELLANYFENKYPTFNRSKFLG